MDGCGGQAHVEEEVVKLIDGRLGGAEDQGAGRRILRHEVVEGSLTLAVVVHLDDDLINVLVGLTWTADANAEVVLGHDLLGESASILGEGGGEEHVDVISVLVGVCVCMSVRRL